MTGPDDRAGTSYRRVFSDLLAELTRACQEVYGSRLVSLAVFGSVGRDRPRPDSDIDIFLVARDLPRGRIPRVDEFSAVEARLEPHLEQARAKGVSTRLSPILLSPEEVLAKGPGFVDMALDALVLHDREGFFASLVKRLRRQLKESGARQVETGGTPHWRLGPPAGGGGAGDGTS
ncbi:MAG TPA: hypothetical protein DHW14_05585 [Clostridiales bacterium]|jgi:hypothetical protein|nr:hypothetical protein [Clostridiales bacterium]